MATQPSRLTSCIRPVAAHRVGLLWQAGLVKSSWTMNALIRVITYASTHVVASRLAAMLGAGPTIPFVVGISAGLLVSTTVGNMLANRSRKRAAGVAGSGDQGTESAPGDLRQQARKYRSWDGRFEARTSAMGRGCVKTRRCAANTKNRRVKTRMVERSRPRQG
jgi:hypothetical protein